MTLQENIQEVRPMLLKANATMSNNGLLHIGTALDTSANYESVQRVYSPLGKCPTLTAVCGGFQEAKVQLSLSTYRRLYAIEYERAMGLPDNYTKGISRSRRYKAIGNGWDVKTLTAIFKQANFDKDITVVSLFDGIACGKVALDKVTSVANYFSSEVDPYPAKVTKLNHADVIELGSVLNWETWDIDWSSVDLLIGGSPCQGFSRAGTLYGTKAQLQSGEIVIVDSLRRYEQLKLEEAVFLSQSFLFWEYVRVLKHIQSKNPLLKFLLENVVMDANYALMFNRELGVEYVSINSNKYGPQFRERFYWFNWDFCAEQNIHSSNLQTILWENV